MIFKKNEKCGCKAKKNTVPVKERVAAAIKKPAVPKRDSGPRR